MAPVPSGPGIATPLRYHWIVSTAAVGAPPAHLDRLAGRPVPPALEGERDEYNRRAEHINRVRVYGVCPDGAVAAGPDPLPPGTLLAVVRDGVSECVAVVRVGSPLGGARYAATAVRGVVRAGDEAVRQPDAGWDQVALAADARR